jgi:5-methylcytosine-specific restriction endonuclease McrA
MNTELRTCNICGCIKPLSGFYLRDYGKRHQRICKQCHNERCHKWQANNVEREKERRRKYYADHPEQHKESCRKWRKEHPERCREISLKHSQTQQGKLASRIRSHNRRSKMKGKITITEWNKIKQQQGFRCYWCKGKFKDEELTMDHVIALSKGGLHDASNIVAACMPCNSKKFTSNWSLI